MEKSRREKIIEWLLTYGWAILIIVVVVAALYAMGVFNLPVSAEQKCINAGAEVIWRECCLSTEDFPNMCLVGPCGCSPENSYEVKICYCGENACWDGEHCIFG